MLVGLSPCQRHNTGNVGDQLITEVTLELIEDVHGETEFEIYFKGEDLTSRLDQINTADAILLLGLEIQPDNTWPDQYRLADDIDDIEPPLIPISSSYSFFPGDVSELKKQALGPGTKTLLDRIMSDRPDSPIQVRDRWVGRVLERNGYETVLTGDPGWYDMEYIGREFHRPTDIDKLVFTTPHSYLFRDQAEELLRTLGRRFDEADRIVSLHSGTRPIDRSLLDTARKSGWRVHHASHETRHLELYRDSDLHVGYRLHGHLAHLRWRRPSIILAEDSRVRGLTETFGTGGVTAFVPRGPSGLGGGLRRFSATRPGIATHLLLKKGGLVDTIPHNSPFKATANPDAVDQVLEFIEAQLSNGWSDFSHIKEVIDETYEDAMRPHLRRVLQA